MIFWPMIHKNNLDIFPLIDIHKLNIVYQRVKRVFQVAQLLYLIAVSGLVVSFYAVFMASSAFKHHNTFSFICYGFIAGYGVIIFLFAQLDACSRYQNYKKAKDLFYENGFKVRIVDLFINSHCQRNAIKVAAQDFGFLKELCLYYHEQGYRWFHILPDFIFKSPLIVFKRKYWERTLFEKRYKSKYFLW